MRLLIINQFYPPDLAPTGHMAASVARHRAALGDQVTVLTGRGGYVPESPTSSSPSPESVQVLRLWTPGLGKSSALRRLADYAAFCLQALLYAISLPAQDVVLSLTTPPFVAWVGQVHRWLHPGTRLVIWMMDCYPETLERSGTLAEHGLVARFLRWTNNKLYRRASNLVCLDQAMRDLIMGRYSALQQTSIAVIPNWEETSLYEAWQEQPAWERWDQLELNGRFVVLYLGNAGHGHQFDSVLEAVADPQLQAVSWLFIGGGAAWTNLEAAQRQQELDTLTLHRYVPEDAKLAVLAAADCGLITMHDHFAGVISPSKLHAYLGMGLPIVYLGPANTNVDEAIQRFGCGISLRHSQLLQLHAFIERLRTEPSYAADLSQRARHAFEAAYNERVNLPKFDRVLDASGDRVD